MSVIGLGAVAREFRKPLSLEQVDFADPKDGEVLVQIRATGVCHTDIHAIDGDWPVKAMLPFIPGHEGVGVVAKTGRLVRGVKEGDRVGLPWLRATCGECEWCLMGWESLCPRASYGGYSANGSFAEYALAPAAYVGHIPACLSDAEAAPILCAGLTSWKALKETEATAGQWVAISGVGGLGQLAIQYAVHMGLHVIAVDIDPQKLWRAKDLGAEITLDAKEQDVAQLVQSQVGGAHGVVVTAVSATAFHQAIGMTRRKGTCVFVGLPPGDFPAPIFDVVMKGLTIRGSLVGTREDLHEALALCAETTIRSPITTQPLLTVNDALDRLRAGQAEGRIVLTM
ncbi:Alcohol dehydrogenase [Acidisarcina polymorpha]|uniref:alcohol dehydrogenase n=1 Tax=Acidisarcina polymorpha TaxID=2211140 RepID=A0A2Z5G6Q7_9BACT|nr:zinc-dependent alcohol dehydrogenase [Acidisarcina polymorpha]AXC14477.1 Alcohol dehydrogenase [Acidisarcina polymorpha]